MSETDNTKSKLTMRQQLFVDSYLGAAGGNASEAARMAGYASPGQEGYRLLKNAEIRAIIGDTVAASAMGRDEVLERLSVIARGVISDCIRTIPRSNGRPPEWVIDLGKAEKAGVLGYIRKIKMDTAGSVSIETADMIKALQLLGQYHGLFGASSGEGGQGGDGGKQTGAPQEMRIEVVYVDERPRTPKGDN